MFKQVNPKNNQIVRAAITWLEMRLWIIWGSSNLFIWTPFPSYTNTQRMVGLQLTEVFLLHKDTLQIILIIF